MKRFNPCFSGIGISTINIALEVELAIEFQSLFFWNRYFDFIYRIGCMRRFLSFNPCFSGIGISTIKTWIDAEKIHEFQSLFFWNRYFDF